MPDVADYRSKFSGDDSGFQAAANRVLGGLEKIDEALKATAASFIGFDAALQGAKGSLAEFGGVATAAANEIKALNTALTSTNRRASAAGASIGDLNTVVEAFTVAATAAATAASAAGGAINIVSVAARGGTTAVGGLNVATQASVMGLRRLGMALGTYVAAPLLGIVGASGVLSANFDAALAKIEGFTGASHEEVEGLRQKFIDLGETVGIMPKQLADGYYYIRSIGMQGKDALDLLTIAAKASAAGLGKMEDISSAMTSVKYAFPQMAINQIGDLVTKTVVLGKTDPSKMFKSLGQVLPIASSLNLKLKDVLATTAIMTRMGMDPAKGFQRMTAFLDSLAKPSSSQRKAANMLGIDFGKFRKELQTNYLGALDELAEKSKGRIDLIKAFAGPRKAGDVGLVVENPALYEENKKVFTGLEDSAGATEKAWQTAAKTILVHWKEMLAAAEGAGIEFGESTKDILIGAIDAVKGAFDWFKSLDPSTKRTIAVVTTLAGALAGVAAVLLTLAPAFAALSTLMGVGAAGGAAAFMTALGGVASAALPVVAGVAAIAASVYFLYKAWQACHIYSTQSTDDAIRNAEANRATAETARDNALKTVELAKQYDALRGKTKLSTDEHAKMQDILNKIASLSPNLVDGFKANGDAIARQGDLAEIATGQLKRMNDQLDLASRRTHQWAQIKADENLYQAQQDLQASKERLRELQSSYTEPVDTPNGTKFASTEFKGFGGKGDIEARRNDAKSSSELLRAAADQASVVKTQQDTVDKLTKQVQDLMKPLPTVPALAASENGTGKHFDTSDSHLGDSAKKSHKKSPFDIAMDSVNEAIHNFNIEIEKGGDDSNLASALYETLAGKWRECTQAAKDMVIAMAALADEHKKHIELLKAVTSGEEEARKALGKSQLDLTAKTDTPEARELKIQNELINEYTKGAAKSIAEFDEFLANRTKKSVELYNSTHPTSDPSRHLAPSDSPLSGPIGKGGRVGTESGTYKPFNPFGGSADVVPDKPGLPKAAPVPTKSDFQTRQELEDSKARAALVAQAHARAMAAENEEYVKTNSAVHAAIQGYRLLLDTKEKVSEVDKLTQRLNDPLSDIHRATAMQRIAMFLGAALADSATQANKANAAVKTFLTTLTSKENAVKTQVQLFYELKASLDPSQRVEKLAIPRLGNVTLPLGQAHKKAVDVDAQNAAKAQTLIYKELRDALDTASGKLVSDAERVKLATDKFFTDHKKEIDTVLAGLADWDEQLAFLESIEDGIARNDAIAKQAEFAKNFATSLREVNKELGAAGVSQYKPTHAQRVHDTMYNAEGQQQMSQSDAELLVKKQEFLTRVQGIVTQIADAGTNIIGNALQQFTEHGTKGLFQSIKRDATKTIQDILIEQAKAKVKAALLGKVAGQDPTTANTTALVNLTNAFNNFVQSVGGNPFSSASLSGGGFGASGIGGGLGASSPSFGGGFGNAIFSLGGLLSHLHFGGGPAGAADAASGMFPGLAHGGMWDGTQPVNVHDNELLLPANGGNAMKVVNSHDATAADRNSGGHTFNTEVHIHMPPGAAMDTKTAIQHANEVNKHLRRTQARYS